jgi:hypothetical protein
MDRPPPLINNVACWKMQREILLWLLERCDDIKEWPWRPIAEVMSASSDPIIALDALTSLAHNGLIRRTDNHVIATRTAYTVYQLITDHKRNHPTA